MAQSPDLVTLEGSERTVLPGARAIEPTNPNERIEVTVRVRAHPSSTLLAAAEATGARLPKERPYLSREEFAAAHGADPSDLVKVEAFAQQHGLDVVAADPARRSVVLAGAASAVSAAFGVKLTEYEHPAGNYRGRVGHVHVPANLVPIVEGVFGLDTRRHARPYIIMPEDIPAIAHAAPISYTPIQLAQLYNFPSAVNGQGQCIGILEFGGGYSDSDLQTYFKHLGVSAPQVSSVSVDGVKNQPGVQREEDGEVALDIEVAGAVAPGAKIVVYFAPFTQRGWVDALTTAIHDSQNKPSVISISWGWTEGKMIWTQAAIRAVDQALQAAAAMGVTVICAAGDDGAADEIEDGLAHVDFPAASPYILACGGTSLRASNNTITSEVVWNDGSRNGGGGATGGGVSVTHPLPSWQANAHVPKSVNPGGTVGRGVPDVAGDADPNTGYGILVHGQSMTIGGTSAVAPLWAGLIALINQKLGKPVGYFNPLLYTQLANEGVFHDITSGNNDTTGHLGGYPAGKGWDACTGWGSPDGTKLMQSLGG